MSFMHLNTDQRVSRLASFLLLLSPLIFSATEQAEGMSSIVVHPNGPQYSDAECLLNAGSLLPVDTAEQPDNTALIQVAERHVKETMQGIRESGEYSAVNLHPDGKLLRTYWLTDWDGDGDNDLFFTFILLGDELKDGRGPIADRIGAVENRDGTGVFRSDIEAYEFYHDGIYEFRIDYVYSNSLYAIASRSEPDDRIMTIEFDGTTFLYAGDRENDGTREVRTGTFIIGD